MVSHGLLAPTWRGDSVTVTLNATESHITVLVDVPDEGMPTTDWLLPNGEVQSEPCASSE